MAREALTPARTITGSQSQPREARGDPPPSRPGTAADPGGPGGPGRVPEAGGRLLRGHGRPRLLAEDDREPAGPPPGRPAPRVGHHPPRGGPPAGAGGPPTAPVPLTPGERGPAALSVPRP